MSTVTAVKKMLYCCLLLMCGHGLLFTASKADTRPTIPTGVIHVASDLWPGFTEPDGKGAYLHLLQLILPVDTELELHFTSFSRSILMAEQQQVLMVIGIGVKDSKQLLLSDLPFDVDEIAVLYLPDQLQLTENSKLSMLRLATQRGYNYELVMNLNNTSYEVDSIRTGVDMVRNQRVDAFLVEKTELQSTINAEDLAGLELRFLKGEPIYMGFANNVRGLELKRWWDYQYQILYRSGQLEPLYQQYPNFILPDLASAGSVLTPAK
ncbi:substrate-binding periplasmic protein [Alkalimonas amylolytica]|uniref:ABC-type amino acid transport substrate-binding protein n=1 Tax=Alkalimonas amylolytica TaxID=152573 RepID=A0A1H4E0X8_ALKAM|nr:transporter substrate-binding domain-containing protein [Alkalimonas amylolytica]SEA78671.1 ABC-type amino acid transport substrate-binding protein [Alkalimonas amylolytica]